MVDTFDIEVWYFRVIDVLDDKISRMCWLEREKEIIVNVNKK